MAETQLAKRKARELPAAVAEQLAQLEQDLGGRTQLISLLTLAPLNDDLRYVLGLLGDPRHERLSLAAICAKGNILPSELLKHLGAAALLRGKTLALQHIGHGIAAVAKDVVERAAPYRVACKTCMVDGVSTGRLVDDPTPEQPNPAPYPCTTCQGALFVVMLPDLDRQKLAIELAGMVQKGGGLNIALQQNLGVGAGGGSGSAGLGALESLQQATDQLLYGEAPTVEAEVVPEEGSSPP